MFVANFLNRFYHQKLENVHKEMLNLSDRAANLKARSLKLLDAKQEEALKRENQRQVYFGFMYRIFEISINWNCKCKVDNYYVKFT